MLHSALIRLAPVVLVGGLAPLSLAAQGDSSAAMTVLPFVNVSGAPADDWIGAGIAETVTAEIDRRPALQSVGGRQVRETMRALAASGAPADSSASLVEVGRAAGARWVVGGGYQRLGARMRITARLVDVRTGAVAAATVVDGGVDQLFDLQDRVAADLFAAAGLDAAQGAARPAPRAADPAAASAGLGEGSFHPAPPFGRPGPDRTPPRSAGEPASPPAARPGPRQSEPAPGAGRGACRRGGRLRGPARRSRRD